MIQTIGYSVQIALGRYSTVMLSTVATFNFGYTTGLRLKANLSTNGQRALNWKADTQVWNTYRNGGRMGYPKRHHGSAPTTARARNWSTSLICTAVPGCCWWVGTCADTLCNGHCSGPLPHIELRGALISSLNTPIGKQCIAESFVQLIISIP